MEHGLAEIDDGQKQTIVLLCEACFEGGETAILRKYWNAPDLMIEKGVAYYSVDQLRRHIADASKERGGKPTN